MKDIILYFMLIVLTIIYAVACYRIDRCIINNGYKPKDYLSIIYIIAYSVIGGYIIGKNLIL